MFCGYKNHFVFLLSEGKTYFIGVETCFIPLFFMFISLKAPLLLPYR